MDLITKLFKFGLVGTLGTAIDFGITYVCKELLGIQKYVANGLGFILAATSNYIWNRTWTFHSKNINIIEEYSTYIVVATFGLMLNSAVLWFMINRYKQNFYVSKLVATGITIMWNFTVNYLITFSEA